MADWAGLNFNPGKCALLHVDGKRHTTPSSYFTIQGAEMRCCDEKDTYCHLGVPTGFSMQSSPVDTIASMSGDLEKIHSSLLAPWQKVDAVNTFVIPRLSFHLK